MSRFDQYENLQRYYDMNLTQLRTAMRTERNMVTQQRMLDVYLYRASNYNSLCSILAPTMPSVDVQDPPQEVFPDHIQLAVAQRLLALCELRSLDSEELEMSLPGRKKQPLRHYVLHAEEILQQRYGVKPSNLSDASLLRFLKEVQTSTPEVSGVREGLRLVVDNP